MSNEKRPNHNFVMPKTELVVQAELCTSKCPKPAKRTFDFEIEIDMGNGIEKKSVPIEILMPSRIPYVRESTRVRVPKPEPLSVLPVPSQDPSVPVQEPKQAPSECVVCEESSINTCLRTCGHLAMCFPCAIKISQAQKNCPICRRDFKENDIIRTYSAK